MWLLADHKSALLLCEAETHEGAEAIRAGYLMVQAGDITYEIHAVQPDLVAEQRQSEAN